MGCEELKPNFCPHCGAKILGEPVPLELDGELRWDTYCDKCGWSGDILPDKGIEYFKTHEE